MTQRVLVLGGGISGLTCAHALVRSGFAVRLIEASDQLGGLGTFFNYQGRFVERFYHCIMPSDRHLLDLIDEVGLTESVYWRRTTMGLVLEGSHYPFNTASDLLRVDRLAILDRLRLGTVSLFLRWLRLGRDLDSMSVKEWLSPLFGHRLWQEFWLPMFQAKFGDAAEALPARYLFERLGRESNVARRGYLLDGYRSLIDALAASITSHGGQLRTAARACRVEAGERGVKVVLKDRETLEADWLVSTIPLINFRKLIRGGPLEPQFRDPEVPYQGVVNALFFLNRPLTRHYWTPILRSDTEFDGVVEMSALAKREQYAGHHLVYAMKYTAADSALFQEDDLAIEHRWTAQLLDLFSQVGLERGHIEAVRLFRAPWVEPIYPLNYERIKPRIRVGNSRVFLATTAHNYPRITSWNSSVQLARNVAAQLASAEARSLPEKAA